VSKAEKDVVRLGVNELPQKVFEILNKEVATVVIATVDEDGSPRTAPFSWIVAKDKRTLRVGMGVRNFTFANVKRNGKVMICLLEEGNIAISIKGKARVIKEKLDSATGVAMVEINIEEIKNDASAVSPVKSGVRIDINDKYLRIVKEVFNELKETP